jgi:predicted transcriptional regulator
MASKGSTKERRRIGRPPAGARAGERVKDYPQLSVRVPGDVKAKLQAISLVSARPQWRIITEAIDCFLRDRTDAERQQVDELAKGPRIRTARSRRR